MSRRVLQICPHDTSPFDDVCARYVEAGERIGADVTTVFLGAAAAQPLPFADYLNVADLQSTADLRHALHRHAQRRWDLVVCHRYRAYWSAAKTGLARNSCVVVAHEFGLLKRWQRRLKRSPWGPRLQCPGP